MTKITYAPDPFKSVITIRQLNCGLVQRGDFMRIRLISTLFLAKYRSFSWISVVESNHTNVNISSLSLAVSHVFSKLQLVTTKAS